ncbi:MULTISPECIES: class I SAM-dependent methyltransferase [unclassified Enterococcus]|uniref:class I SAM-dependent methyltransferase n=1 Tax=unclassified Enterococcus TaxID=2608891 RepID=UPI001552EB9A|nr:MULTISPECIES: class I SAM-dependent methyltransferase [unclassified Enterococcus]MBS7576138.1 class I SAM-dependent methyltransferase [Enterococcus sp. MMGLQ5-2]MBS7583371.1 class I SAM-dependent methyltransferase [Enterococcus sp. MMGLQ5-1]NPD11231.1 class I SAM-dependent methyltransferase [Enterococcus sp. MMGLQ5-1]NPD35974.1 class I SAM-dependent methyltransferase [Enterococcus sp. MMGLQ5-2]
MGQMYYAENPDVAHDIHQLKVTLKGLPFHFYTDAGVFSKTAVDFGTQLLLETLNFNLDEAGSLLDVGCGYGPIGLTYAKTTECQVTMIDINQRAIALAQKNAVLNQIKNVEIMQSNLYEKITGQFDGIISNPPIRAGKKVVHQILAESIQYLRPNGTLTIVIQKKQGAPSAKEKMLSVFGNVTVLAKKKGYYILQSVKQLN